MKIGSSTVTKHDSYFLCGIAPLTHRPNCGSFAVASSIVSDCLLDDPVDIFIRDNRIGLASKDESVQHELYIGNKSINQLKLWIFGHHIPDTVILDFSFFDMFKKNGEAALQALYNEQIANQLGPSLAIRCSSNLEDREDRSFAGTFDTHLNVANDVEVFKEKVLESFIKFSSSDKIPPQFRGYRLRLGVMVQNMIRTKYSGFLFTTDPMNPPNQWLKVEYWQGERDQSISSSLTLNKENGKVIDSDTENSHVSLPMEHQKKLHQLAVSLDVQFNSPQDAEFLISDKDDYLYLVQTRPITAFNYSPDKVRLHEREKLRRLWNKNLEEYQREPILSSTNISELFVRAIPLGYSIYKYGFAGTHEKAGGISIGRSTLGYAALDLEDQVNFFYTIGDQARTNLIVDALTFRLPGITKAEYLDYFVQSYFEAIEGNPDSANYPEHGLYLQTDNLERWLAIAGEKGAKFRREYAHFLQTLIEQHAPREYERASPFFEKNENFYRDYLSHDGYTTSDEVLKKKIHEVLEYLRSVFCPQYVVFARLAFLCTHVAKQKLNASLDSSVPYSSEQILNELLQSVHLPPNLESPNYPYYEHLLKQGEITLSEFLDRFQHLGSLDINQPRMGEFSIGELYTIFGQNKSYDHGDDRLSAFSKMPFEDIDLSTLGLLNDPDFKRWYTHAGRFMRLREHGKFELLKVVYVLKRLIIKFARIHRFREWVFYLEHDELLDLDKNNREQYRVIALKRKAYFEACHQQKVKDVIGGSEPTPFGKNALTRNQHEKKGYNFTAGTSVYYGPAEGVCLTARSNAEYLKKLAVYRSENIENIIGVFKGVELSYFNLGALTGFTTENGGYLSHAATISREFRLPYITGINVDNFQDGDYVILDTENNQVIHKTREQVILKG